MVVLLCSDCTISDDEGKKNTGVRQKVMFYLYDFGLSGIRERVKRRNGEMSIESRAGEGTSVTVTLAIDGKERDEQ